MSAKKSAKTIKFNKEAFKKGVEENLRTRRNRFHQYGYRRNASNKGVETASF